MSLTVITKNLAIFAAALLTANLSNAASKVAENLPLGPYPQEVLIQKGNFIPAKHLSISREVSLTETAETVAMDLSEIGFHIRTIKRMASYKLNLNILSEMQIIYFKFSHNQKTNK